MHVEQRREEKGHQWKCLFQRQTVECFSFNTVFSIVTLLKKYKMTRISLWENFHWKQFRSSSCETTLRALRLWSYQPETPNRKNSHLKRLVDLFLFWILHGCFGLILLEIRETANWRTGSGSLEKAWMSCVCVCVCVHAYASICPCLSFCLSMCVCLFVMSGSISAREVGKDRRKKKIMLIFLWSFGLKQSSSPRISNGHISPCHLAT